jgi:hypothetical protein
VSFPYHVKYQLFQLLVDDFHLNFGFLGRYKLSETCDHKEHTSSVFHFNAKKVFSDALSYARMQAVDQYLKEIGQPLHKKREASSFYLTEEQYREVMYLTIIYPQLLILQISSQTMEYICVGPGAVYAK